MSKFYFNLQTRQVEQGKQSVEAVRMGPYDTYDEAANALSKAEARSQEWDEETRAWNAAWDAPERDQGAD